MDRVIRSCSIYDREPKDIRCKRDTSLNSDKSCISKHIYRAVNCSHKQACLSINCRSTSIRKKNDQMTKSALPYGIFWVSVNAGDTLNVAVNGILNSIKGPATVKMTSNDAKIINSLYMPTSQTVWYPVPYKSECILGTTVKNQIHKQYINQRNCKFNFKDKPHQQLEQKCPELPDNKASKGSTNTPVNDVHTEPVFFINTINPNPMYIATASNDQQNIAATRSVLISYLSSVPPPAVVEVDSHSIKILIDHSIASVLLSSEEFALCTSVDLKCNGKIRDKLCSIKDNKRCDNDFKEIYQGIATEIYVIDLKPANRYSVRCRLAIVSKDTQFFGHHSMSSEFTTEPDVPDPPEEVFVHLHNIKDGIKLTWMDSEDNGSPITFYNVEISTDEGKNYYSITKPSVPYAKLKSLNPLSNLHVRVSASNDMGNSRPSKPVGFTVPSKWRHRQSAQTIKRQFLSTDRLICNQTTIDKNSRYSSPVEDSTSSDASNFFEDHINDSGIRSYSDDDMFWKIATSDNNSQKQSASQSIESRSTPSSGYYSSIPVSTSYSTDYPIPFECICVDDGSGVMLKWDKIENVNNSHIIVELNEALSDRNRTWMLPISETSLKITEFRDLEWNFAVKIVRNLVSEDVELNNDIQCDDSKISQSSDNNISDDLVTELVASNIETKKVHLQWQHQFNLPGNDGMNILECDSESLTANGTVQLYKGRGCQFTHENLLPYTEYKYTLSVRTKAENCNGRYDVPSHIPCDTIVVRTLPDFPSSVQFVTSECISTGQSSVDIKWVPPSYSGGCSVKYYMVYKDSKFVLETENLSCSIDNLLPKRTYEFRVRAVNQAGLSGTLSESISLITDSLQYDAPSKISMSSSSWNSIVLCWNAHCCQVADVNKAENCNNDNILTRCSDINYTVELIHFDAHTSDVKRTKPVYNGYRTVAKVCKLREDTLYAFRVRASCNKGDSHWSECFKFRTKYAPPTPILTVPSCKQLTPQHYCIQWATGKQKAKDTEYILEMRQNDEEQYQKVYCGSKLIYRAKKLKPNTTYQVRVWTRRRVLSTEELISTTASPPATFTTGSQLLESNNGQKSPSLVWTEKFLVVMRSLASYVKHTLFYPANFVYLQIALLLSLIKINRISDQVVRLYSSGCYLRHTFTILSTVTILMFILSQLCTAITSE